MLADLLSTLRLRGRQQRQTADDAYQSLVRQVADGDDPDADAVYDVLTSAERSADDLERDVQRLVDRRGWRAALDARPKLQKRLASVNAKIEDEKERFRDQRDEHELVLAALNHDAESLQAEINRTDTAAVKLHESSDVAGRQSQIATDRIVPLNRKRERLGVQLRQEEAAERQARFHGDDDKAEQYAAAAESLRSEIADITRQIQLAQAESDALQQEAFAV